MIAERCGLMVWVCNLALTCSVGIEREPVWVGVAITLPPEGRCLPCVRLVSVNWVGMVPTENNSLLRKSVIFLVVLYAGWQVSGLELGRRTTR